MSQKHYTHLSYEERVLIEDWSKSKEENKPSLRKFAKHLRRSPATISRELDRNSRPPINTKIRVNKPHADGRRSRGSNQNQANIDALQRYWKRRTTFMMQSRLHYTAKAAEKNSLKRVKRPGLLLERPENEELLSFVITALDSGWTPEEISGRIYLERIYNDISDTAIYDYIKAHPELRLKDYLPHKGRRYRYKTAKKFNDTNREKHHIDDRPEEVGRLSRFGDIEGDTIVGKDKTDRILTHVERKSLLLSMSLIIGFNADGIVEHTVNDIIRIFGIMTLQTITYDNGVEFVFWQLLEQKLQELDARLKENSVIFFANAYHSWERGRNENMNGRIRRFIPKGTDFKTLTENDILMIESLLNNTPRKCLGWLTPNEYYALHTHKASVALEGWM